MTAATLQGMQDALADPDAAYEISKKYVEGLDKSDPAVQKQVLALSMDLWKAPKIGYSDEKAWDNMNQLLLKMGQIQQPQDLSKLYSNAYLP